ncbi:MAG: antitoxin VapB family protein [Nanoarchaeota archaeon]
MATTSITITDEAYHYLKSIKGGRSFSETILGLSRSTNDIMKFAGVLRKADLKSVEHVRKDINKDWDDRN